MGEFKNKTKRKQYLTLEVRVAWVQLEAELYKQAKTVANFKLAFLANFKLAFLASLKYC